MAVLTSIVNALIQIVIFLVLPFLWWFLTDRKNFFNWLGFKKITVHNQKNFLASTILILIFSVLISVYIVPYVVGISDMATAEFSGKGLSALIPAIIYAFFKTSLAEELFFRGFIGKRLIARLGFHYGNFIQASLFGILHFALFYSLVGPVKSLVVLFLTGLMGWLMGYINEKGANGSILPSWIVHGVVNMSASLMAMFHLY